MRNIVIILTVIITLYIGNVYIADTYNIRIRFVSAATGNITTIAVLMVPYDIAVDSSGRSTLLLGLVREVIILKIIMLTLLSTGNVYTATAEDSVIRFVSASTGDISTIAGGGDYTRDGGAATSALLNNNYGVAVDSSGSALTTYSGLCLLSYCFFASYHTNMSSLLIQVTCTSRTRTTIVFESYQRLRG